MKWDDVDYTRNKSTLGFREVVDTALIDVCVLSGRTRSDLIVTKK